MATLHIIATPLGNLEDFSPRAVRTLSEVEVVYAEDTRRSRVLLEHFGVKKPLKSLHEHNERERAHEVLAVLAGGGDVALLSDAGTPAVSDPGSELVAQVVKSGHTVSPVPGPSALTAALSVAGFSRGSHGVRFVGFLPAKGGERRQAIEALGDERGVVVLFEAPHRLRDLLEALWQLSPQRPLVVCRELTKLHEDIRHGTVESLREQADELARGELTLVLGPNPAPEVSASDAEIDAALSRCIEAGLSGRDAAAAVAAILSKPRREVYARYLAMKG